MRLHGFFELNLKRQRTIRIASVLIACSVQVVQAEDYHIFSASTQAPAQIPINTTSDLATVSGVQFLGHYDLSRYNVIPTTMTLAQLLNTDSLTVHNAQNISVLTQSANYIVPIWTQSGTQGTHDANIKFLTTNTGSFTFSVPITVESNSAVVFDTIANATVSLEGALAGTGSFEVSGPGVVALTGSNPTVDFGGAVTVGVSSQLNLDRTQTFKNIAGSGVVNIADGKTLTLAQTNMTEDTLTAHISGLGSFVKGGTGLLTVNNVNNNFTGGFSFNAGTVKIENSSTIQSNVLAVGPLGRGDVYMTASTAALGSTTKLDLNGQSLHNNIHFAGVIDNSSSAAAYIKSTGTIYLSPSSPVNAFRSTGLDAQSNPSGLFVQAPIVNDPNSTSLSVQPVVISEGRVIFSNSNTYNSNTVVSSGATLALTGAGTLGATNTITVDGNFNFAGITPNSLTLSDLGGAQRTAYILIGDKSLVLDHASPISWSGSIGGTGSLVNNTSALRLTGDNSNFSGSLVVNAPVTIGDPSMTANTFLEESLTVTNVSGSSTLSISIYQFLNYNVPAQTTKSLTTPLEGYGSLRLNGPGSLSLDAANTLTGIAEAKLGGVLKANAVGAINHFQELHAINGTLDFNGYAPGSTATVYANNATDDLLASPATIQNSLANSSISIATVRLRGESFEGMPYVFDTVGDITIHNLIPASQGDEWVFDKTGSGTLRFSQTEALEADSLQLNVRAGRMIIQQEMPEETDILLETLGSTLRFDSEERCSYNANISGAGSLEIRSEYCELYGDITHTGSTTIFGANTNLNLASSTAVVGDSFTPTGDIILEGTLLTTLSNDTEWMNTISGDGVLKKYGVGTLTLSGTLSGFTGAMQVLEGSIITNSPLSQNLELYSGSTLYTSVEIGANQSVELNVSGTLNGNYTTNNGTAYINVTPGNTAFINSSAVYGQGTWNVGGGGNVRFGSEYMQFLSLQLNAGETTIGRNAQIQSSSSIPMISVGQQACLRFEPGCTVSANMNAYGQVKILAFNTDPDIYFSGNVHLYENSTMDIVIDSINEQPNAMSVGLHHLIMDANSTLTLRPTIHAHSLDRPLVTFSGSGSFTFADNPENLAKIVIIPQEVVTANSLTEPLTALKIMQISHTDSLSNEARNNIISRLQSTVLFDMTSEIDQDGYLSCSFTPRTIAELFESSNISIAPENRYLLQQILDATQTPNSLFAKELLSLLTECLDPMELNRRAQSLIPQVLQKFSSHSAISSGASSSLAQSAMRSVRTGATITRDITALQGRSDSSSAFFKKALKAQAYGIGNVASQIAHATDPGTQARMQDYQNIDLNGLSFGSQTSYTHENQKSQGDDNPGSSQTSWATSVVAAYTKNQQLSFGATGTTTYSRSVLNPNQLEKTGEKKDHYNTGGLFGMYIHKHIPLYVSGVATYGQHNYATTRTWTQITSDDSFVSEATADFKGYEFYLTNELGWKIPINATTVVQPFAGYSFSHLHTDSFEEVSTTVSTGEPNGYGIIAEASNTSTWAFNGGVEVVTFAKLGEYQCEVFTRLGMTTQKNTGEDTTFTYAYTGDPTIPLSQSVENQRYNTFDVNFGIHTALKDNLFMSSMYSGNYGKYGNTHTAMVSLEYHIG